MATQATYVVMAIATLALLFWDIHVASNDTPNIYDTESGLLLRLGRVVSGVPFLWGICCGHFWGPSLAPTFSGAWPVVVVVGVSFLLTSVHFLLSKFLRFPSWFWLVYLALGMPSGAFLWPQGG